MGYVLIYGPNGKPANTKLKMGFAPTQSRDTRPVQCRFFDRDNALVGRVMMPPRREFEPPRTMEYGGAQFIEGDGTGFYGENEFAEVVS